MDTQQHPGYHDDEYAYIIDAYLERGIRHLTWVGPVFESALGRVVQPMGMAILVGIVVYAGGLLLAAALGLARAYLDSGAVVVAAFGLGWSMLCVHLVTRSIRRALLDLRSCVDSSDEVYDTAVTAWFLKSASREWNWLGFFIVAGGLLLAGYALSLVYDYGSGPFRRVMFARPLVSQPSGSVVIGYYALVMGFAGGAALKAVIAGYRLLAFFRRLTFRPDPYLMQRQLAPVTRLSLFGTYNWCIGVSLIGVLFFDDVTMVSSAVLAALALPAVYAYFSIQFTFRRRVQHRGLFDALRRYWLADLGGLIVIGIAFGLMLVSPLYGEWIGKLL
jgi:hypothetical protein